MDPLTPISDILQNCPCCGVEGSLVPFEVAQEIDGSLTRIALCRFCSVLLNLDSYSAFDEQNPEALQAGDFYEVGNFGRDDHIAAIANAADNLIGYLVRTTGLNPDGGVFCEIGVGRGYSTLAAARQFRAAYGLDFDLRHIRQVCDLIGWPTNLRIGRMLSDVDEKIDVLMAWHALEHFPQPFAFLKEARDRLNSRGYFFFQVPLFRQPYLLRSHHVFFNETAMRELMRRVGMETVEIGFDTDLSFLTVIARAMR